MALRQWSLALLPLSVLTLTACGGSRAEGPGIGGEGNLGSGAAIGTGGHAGSVANAGAADDRGGLTGIGGAGAKAGSGGGGTSAGGGGAGGTSGSGGTSGTTNVACPPDVPVAGSACGASVGRCTWGDAPLLACRTSGICAASGWQLTAPPAYCTSTAPGCAALLAGGVTCSDTSLVCLSGESQACSCVPCNCEATHPPGPPCAACPTGQPLGSLVLSCRSALTLGAPCPSIVPNAGAACDSPGMACPPSACQDTIAVCTNGVWRWNQSNLCPVCASPDTPIATPLGERAIAELRVGDLVYSVDNGAIMPVRLVSVGKTPVTHHHVVRLVFREGRSLEISAGHPTGDGRTFGDLQAGGQLDRHEIISAEVVPYRHAFTYDVLPDSSTGTYFAAGALIGSTLAPQLRTP